MKLASFINPETRQKTYGRIDADGIIDLGRRFSDIYADIPAALRAGALKQFEAVQGAPDFRFEQVTFLPVIEQPGKILCVGMNYMEKRIEFQQTVDAPTLFIRFADTLSAHRQPLMKPESSNEFDYEGELAVVIGQHADNVSCEAALDVVAGYSCFMDGSVRDMQYTWFTSGKNWRHTGGFGPWMVTADEIGDPQQLDISTFLNGVRVQHDTTNNMVRSVAELIAYISRFTPLAPGDVIITGSPGGVGKKRTPPLFMKAGDVVEVEISQIGRLVNTVAAERDVLAYA
ncbi:fumarylacetoacetate hydrolase family protein [Symbiopectobacterium purcellii]|uniref:Fumarylacetoacetate hydrolase family protein n=1 Tax=Symbiopectobacterium purcellii TaxID=2871826 RepID=A0ABX9ASS8_9ENTR|nr:fumarylacetoacetate hydrolase family protein [Symbiopectobacterium purcellii]QZN96035.1 fumarylacetoacetate hydrolase family protein [Symbiopectobacterium purcellii]